MLTITCFGGSAQIGGNQVLVEDQDKQTRFLLDFGTPFSEWNKYYEEFIRPRPGAGLLDVLTMGLLPPIRGLYRDDLEFPEDVWTRVAPLADLRGQLVHGVFVSHAHLDHSGYISFLRQNIPIYASAKTSFIAKAVQDTQGTTEFEQEVAYFGPRERSDEDPPYLETMKETIEGYQRKKLTQRQFAFIDVSALSSEAEGFWNKLVISSRKQGIIWHDLPVLTHPLFSPPDIEGLPVEFFPVDHSIPGASAIAVATSAGWLAYTGDIRLSGKERGKTAHFIERLSVLRPRVLLCEGTRAGEAHSITEEEVFDNALKAVQKAAGKLIVADFGARNVERLLTFLAVSEKSKRSLVILSKDAYLLRSLSLLDPSVPTPEQHKQMLVYKAPKERIEAWERQIRNQMPTVVSEDIRRNPGDYILCFSYWDIKHLIDIDVTDGLYIYSSSEVYSEDQAMDTRRLHNWLDRFQFQRLGLPVEVEKGLWQIPDDERGLHASGHASGEEITEMILTIQPETVIPIHTEQPNFFIDKLSRTNINVAVPEYGEPLGFQ